jgi:hypothetical protein
MDLDEGYYYCGLDWMKFKPQWFKGMTNASVVATGNWNAAFCTANYHRD